MTGFPSSRDSKKGSPGAPCGHPTTGLSCRPLLKVAAKLAGVVGLLLLSAGVAASALRSDRSPPTAPRIVGPRATSNTRPVYSFSATDRQTTRSRLRYRCAFDTLRLHTCASRFSQTLRVGRHQLRAQALDRAGNQSKVTSITVVVSR